MPEVKYDDAWHLYDGSLMSYFTKPDGKTASVDEISSAVQDWHAKNPGYRGDDGKLRAFALNEGWKKGPELLNTGPDYDKNGINSAGWHGWPSNMQEYDTNPQKAFIFDYGPSIGYQLNIQLRPGEKLTRNWFNKGLFIPGDKDSCPLKNDRSYLGFQTRLGDKAPGRVGNGTLEYIVPLASGVFKTGALLADNLASTADDKAAPAVHAADTAKPGVLILRMPSSYIYHTGTVDLKAAVGPGGSIALSFSDNNGLDWKAVKTLDSAGDQKIDLSDLCYARYDYRLKFEFNGQGTGLDALKITHDIQHAQTPLPLLLEGENTITFNAGAAEGTITYEGNPNIDEAKTTRVINGQNKTIKQLALVDYHPEINGCGTKLLQVGDTGRGEVTFKVATPGEMTRLRTNGFYRARDASEGWDVEASFDAGKTFNKVARWDKGQPANSKYTVFSAVPEGTKEALVRLKGQQRNTLCIFGLRIDADYKEPCGGFAPVKITYVWDEGGAEKRNEHVCKSPQETYKITCGPKTVSKSIILELAGPDSK